MESNRLRILMITLNQVGRGTYIREWHFARVLTQRGHSVVLMAMSKDARVRLVEREIDGVHVVETPDALSGSLRSGWDLWDTACRIGWLRDKRFDIVHAAETRPVVLFPALAAKRRGAKLVLDWCDWFGRGGSVEERPNRLLRSILRPVETYFEEHYRTAADGTVTINSFLRDRAIGLGVPPSSIAVIHNGADVRTPLLDKSVARGMLGFPASTPLVGYIGVIYPTDARFMADSFNRLLQLLPSAQLLLAGYFNRAIEPMLSHPEAAIRTGWLSDEAVHQVLAACDVFWVPMRDTGANRGRWPLKLSAYMSAGRPTVVTAVGDQTELVERLGVGVAVRDDPDEFASRTADLLSDPATCKRMGAAARSAAEGEMSWERMTDRLEAFFRQVVAS